MEKYLSDTYPELIFSTPEAAKDFADKLELEYDKIVEYLFLSNDEKTTTHIGYGIIINGRLFQ